MANIGIVVLIFIVCLISVTDVILSMRNAAEINV